MILILVNSSSIRAAGCGGHAPAVQFQTSDTIYEHPGVPPSVYIGRMQTASMGCYYVRHIKGKYR